MAFESDPAAVAEIRALLREGELISALKLYRIHTGAGLAEAKAFIDRLLADSAAGNRPSRELLDDAVAKLTQAAGYKLSSSDRHCEAAEDSERLAAAALAQTMLDRAYALCEQCRDGRLDYDAVLAQLQADCPGFSRSAYELARGDAMLASR